MHWIQWVLTAEQNKIGPSKIHATVNGRLTLCDKPVPDLLTLDSQSPPRDSKAVCKLCKRAEEEGRPYLGP